MQKRLGQYMIYPTNGPGGHFCKSALCLTNLMRSTVALAVL